jgi:hypothetical protein
MITLRQAADRGHAEHGWLESYHTFSFADYFDPNHMGFRSLRVINEDRVQGGQGFGTHPHRDMEIVTYVLDGALEHKDSMGNGSVIRPGEVQRMSAGTGVTHSEFNRSPAELVHFLQIWILPERTGIEPSYEQRMFPPEQRINTLRLVGSHDGREDSLTIHQDVDLFTALLEPRMELVHALSSGRHAWLQVARGEVTLNGRQLQEGDGAAVSDETTLRLQATSMAEILLFNLA